MAMKECFGHGMQWWVPVKQGITNVDKQRECYECEDFEMCSKAHLVHSYRHLTEIILHQDSFNVAVGEKLWLPQGCGWKCSQAQTRLTIRPLTKPTDALTITGTVYVRELT